MANYTDGNDAAFARPGTNQSGSEYGLTKREYFAAQALIGVMANQGSSGRYAHNVALDAVELADAMIEVLNGEVQRVNPSDVINEELNKQKEHQ